MGYLASELFWQYVGYCVIAEERQCGTSKIVAWSFTSFVTQLFNAIYEQNLSARVRSIRYRVCLSIKKVGHSKDLSLISIAVPFVCIYVCVIPFM